MTTDVAVPLTCHGYSTQPRAIAVPTQPPYPHRDLTRPIIGGFYAVYNELGFGFVESIYEAALHITEIKRPVFPNARKRGLGTLDHRHS